MAADDKPDNERIVGRQDDLMNASEAAVLPADGADIEEENESVG